VQNNRVWERACGLKRTVVEGVDEAGDAVIVSVRPNSRARNRCGRCGRRSPGYDQGDGRRRWRALDAGTPRVFIEADAQRVQCRAHGPTVAQVPWARHDTGHTRDFDAMAAWLTVRTSKSATCQLRGVAWRTIEAIVTRVLDAPIPAHNEACLVVKGCLGRGWSSRLIRGGWCCVGCGTARGGLAEEPAVRMEGRSRKLSSRSWVPPEPYLFCWSALSCR
jgi:transposase